MRFVSLQSKDVINVYDGKKIGYIADIELDWCQKCIRALIVEKMNFFHFFPLISQRESNRHNLVFPFHLME